MKYKKLSLKLFLKNILMPFFAKKGKEIGEEKEDKQVDTWKKRKTWYRQQFGASTIN